MISDDDIDKALNYLRDSAIPAAQATANRQHLENTKHSMKAILMAEHIMEPVNAQERWAFADDRYKVHLDGLKEAIFEDEKYTNLREAAEAKIRAWQTMNATLRAEGKAYS
jgi:hypothetical protein